MIKSFIYRCQYIGIHTSIQSKITRNVVGQHILLQNEVIKCSRPNLYWLNTVVSVYQSKNKV